jgi:hypothetical protein
VIPLIGYYGRGIDTAAFAVTLAAGPDAPLCDFNADACQDYKLQVQRHTALRICRARHGFSLWGRFVIVSSADRYTQSNRLDHMVDSTYTGLSDTFEIQTGGSRLI